jgi:hypothetical protein
MPDLSELLRCPRCGSRPQIAPGEQFKCLDAACEYSSAGFPVVSGQPALIDFEHSVFDRSAYRSGSGSVLPRDDSGRDPRMRLGAFIQTGPNLIGRRMQ